MAANANFWQLDQHFMWNRICLFISIVFRREDLNVTMTLWTTKYFISNSNVCYTETTWKVIRLSFDHNSLKTVFHGFILWLLSWQRFLTALTWISRIAFSPDWLEYCKMLRSRMYFLLTRVLSRSMNRHGDKLFLLISYKSYHLRKKNSPRWANSRANLISILTDAPQSMLVFLKSIWSQNKCVNNEIVKMLNIYIYKYNFYSF